MELREVSLTDYRQLRQQQHALHQQWAEEHHRELVAIRTTISGPSDNALFVKDMTISSAASFDINTAHQSLQSFPRYRGTKTSRTSQRLQYCEQDRKVHSSYAVTNAAKQRNHYVARILPPTWLATAISAFEISGYKALHGWTLNLRTYNIVPRESSVMTLAAKGDLIGLQTLFKERKASPFDRTPQMQTVLEVWIKLLPFTHRGIRWRC
jgi:hypothetical protein